MCLCACAPACTVPVPLSHLMHVCPCPLPPACDVHFISAFAGRVFVPVLCVSRRFCAFRVPSVHQYRVPAPRLKGKPEEWVVEDAANEEGRSRISGPGEFFHRSSFPVVPGLQSSMTERELALQGPVGSGASGVYFFCSCCFRRKSTTSGGACALSQREPLLPFSQWSPQRRHSFLC